MRRHALTVLLATVLVVSTLAPIGALATTAPPRGPPDHVGLPSNAVEVEPGPPTEPGEPLPRARSWSASTSAHAGSLNLLVTRNARGSLVLNWTDDRNHEGREVAVNATALVEATGHQPDRAFGVDSETGEEWVAPVRYDRGMAIVEVPHFSTQSVTFDSEVNLTGTPAVDGAQYRYNLSDLDGIDNFTIDVTGSTATEWDNESAAGVGDGGSVSLAVAGSTDPSGPSANGEPVVEFVGESSSSSASTSATDASDGSSTSVSVGGEEASDASITFDGDSSTTNGDQSGSVDPGGSFSISNPGNLDPTGPSASSNPELTLTNPTTNHSEYNDGQYSGSSEILKEDGGVDEAEVAVATNGETVTHATVCFSGNYGFDGSNVNVYVQSGQADGNPGGTKVGTITFDSGNVCNTWSFAPVDTSSSGWLSVGFDQVSDPGDGDVITVGTSSKSDGVTRVAGNHVTNTVDAPEMWAWAEATSITASSSGTGTVSYPTLGPGESTTKEFDIDSTASTANIGGSGPSLDYTLDKDDRTATEDPSIDVNGDGVADASHTGILSSGETATASVGNWSTSVSSVDTSLAGGTVDWTVDWTRVDHTDDPAVDLDGDGTPEASHTGLLAPGETASYELASLSTSTTSANISLTDATVGTTFRFEERQQTTDPAVEVNGQTTSYAGTLADGETVALSPESSWLHEGENTVNVSAASSSTDAPTGETGLDYSHAATSTISATRNDSEWIETYNVSKTFASNRSSASSTLPFGSSVVEIHSVEKRVNGGSWETVPAGEFTLNATDLVVDLGSVTESDEVEVRAEGRKVNVRNGAIEVIEPTIEGDALDSKIEITNATSNFAIEVSENRTHYAASESWESPDDHAVISGGGSQELHLPNANDGSTTRVRRASFAVVPEAGEIEAVVVDADEPRFRIRTGDSSGADKVEITYYDTVSGTTYTLHSVTRDKDVISDTAASPVYFTTDGDAETYTIIVGSSSGESNAAVSVDGSGSALGIGALFAGVAASMIGFYVVGRRLGARGRTANALLVVGGAVVGLIGVELATGRSVVSDLVFATGDVVGGFASTGAGTVAIGIAMLIAIYLLRNRLGLPRWVLVAAGIGIAIFTIDGLSEGAFVATVGELGPLAWLILLVGGVVLVWRALKPTTISIEGVRR